MLVAAAATDSTPARIFKVDFQTGSPIVSPNPAEADGTNVPQFQADAIRHLALLRSGAGDTTIPLDIWVSRCVGDAVGMYPAYIAPPIDALVARPSIVGERILVHRRMSKLPPPSLDLFRVP